jgi:hypothetical protein
MVFENRVVRKLLGPRKDEIPAEWKILHNEELNDHQILFGLSYQGV